MADQPPVSGYLALRAAAAKSKATSIHAAVAAKNAAQPAAQKPHSAAPKPQTLDQPHAQIPPSTQPTAQKAAKKASPQSGKELASQQRQDNPEPISAPAADQQRIAKRPDDDAIISVFQQTCTGDPRFVDISMPHIPAIFRAILVGAKKPGSTGDKDRTRLFRILGLPFADTPRPFGGRSLHNAASMDTASGLDVLAQRLSRAHARVTGHSRVTATLSVTSETADDGPFQAVAHLLPEQVRYPGDAEDEPEGG